MIDIKKSIPERIFHAITYELIAIILCTPLFAWIFNTPLEKIGILNIAVAVIAMIWNMLFNAAYDRLALRFGFTKTLIIRITHGIAFEGG
jgi:uncharacterized membrane protein